MNDDLKADLKAARDALDQPIPIGPIGSASARRAAGAWTIAYLFTIGLADLGGWDLLWALFFWPAYIGRAMHILLTSAP